MRANLNEIKLRRRRIRARSFATARLRTNASCGEMRREIIECYNMSFIQMHWNARSSMECGSISTKLSCVGVEFKRGHSLPHVYARTQAVGRSHVYSCGFLVPCTEMLVAPWNVSRSQRDQAAAAYFSIAFRSSHMHQRQSELHKKRVASLIIHSIIKIVIWANDFVSLQGWTIPKPTIGLRPGGFRISSLIEKPVGYKEFVRLFIEMFSLLKS